MNFYTVQSQHEVTMVFFKSQDYVEQVDCIVFIHYKLEFL